MASYRGTPLHAMRIPDEVWQAARTRATESGTSLNAEVVAFLDAYGKGYAEVVKFLETYATGERHVTKARVRKTRSDTA